MLNHVKRLAFFYFDMGMLNCPYLLSESCHCTGTIKYSIIVPWYYQRGEYILYQSFPISIFLNEFKWITQRNATQRNATQRNATQRNATQRNATQRNATQRNATQRNATQRNATQCNAMQCNAMQCNAMQCNAKISRALSSSQDAWLQNVKWTWRRCLGDNAEVTMPRWRCLGDDAEVTMPRWRCRGDDAEVTMPRWRCRGDDAEVIFRPVN